MQKVVGFLSVCPYKKELVSFGFVAVGIAEPSIAKTLISSVKPGDIFLENGRITVPNTSGLVFTFCCTNTDADADWREYSDISSISFVRLLLPIPIIPCIICLKEISRLRIKSDSVLT